MNSFQLRFGFFLENLKFEKITQILERIVAVTVNVIF